MRIHYLQHVPFEGLGSIEATLLQAGHQLSSTQLYDKEPLPTLDELDWLIVMGGPMGIYDEQTYPWLVAEKTFLREAIDAGKIVLGICLGAQLIADVLGAKVYPNRHKEIGWFKLNPAPVLDDTILANSIPKQALVYHWHGDTFDIPEGAQLIASSEACTNQGFIYDDRVLALQFHLETTVQSATALIEHCRDELDNSQYVQSADAMLNNHQRFSDINQIMQNILHKFS